MCLHVLQDLQDLDQRLPSSLISLIGCVAATFIIMIVPILMTPQIVLPFAIILFLNLMLMVILQPLLHER